MSVVLAGLGTGGSSAVLGSSGGRRAEACEEQKCLGIWMERGSSEARDLEECSKALMLLGDEAEEKGGCVFVRQPSAAAPSPQGLKWLSRN